MELRDIEARLAGFEGPDISQQPGPQAVLLKISAVANILSLSRSQTYALIASRVIPSIRIGKSLRVHSTDLQAFIDEQRQSR
jgi:excisionase family DNA binding protein